MDRWKLGSLRTPRQLAGLMLVFTLAGCGTITVEPAVISNNSPPTITGLPAGSIAVNAGYSFVPNASDDDGDVLSFSIVNKPGWAAFDTTTGKLNGIPVNSDVGTVGGIVITVSDGVASDLLGPFSIAVSNVNAQPPAYNAPPALSFVSPSGNETFNAGADIDVVVDAFDYDSGGSIANVRLYLDGDFVRQNDITPYEWPASQDAALRNLPVGTHILTAVATDNGGRKTENSITITIQCDVSTPNLACGLLGYWRFEEPVYFGRKHGVMDYSLAGHNATPINGVQHTTTGKLGRALAFNGTDEYITTDDQALEALQSGSIATWVKTTNSTSQVLMQRGSGTQPQLAIDGSGHISFSLDTGSTTHTLLSDPGYNDGNWHHIVASWGTSGMQLFVDDSQVANNGYTGTWQASPGAWYIGAASAGQSGLFKGALDEASIWNRQLTSNEVASLYNAGKGQIISVGPVITQFQSRKMIYQPTENVIFDLAINSDQLYTDAKIDLWVEQEVDTKIHVYSQPHQIAPGAQQISIDWPLSGTGLNNNVNGHLARVTVKDSSGRIIAEKETLFDVVDDWWKVMRLAGNRGNTAARPGNSDASIDRTVAALRGWGFNTFELYHYADPWDLNPAGDTWEDIDYPGTYISGNRAQYWGTALHAQGMKYLAYNETSAIRGPVDWQVRWKDGRGVYSQYYTDLGYFVPNLPLLSQRWEDENIDAINGFDFDGILMDSAYSLGYNVTLYCNDNNGSRIPQYPSVGSFMHDWLGPAKTNVRAVKDTFAYVSQNAYPLTTVAINTPLDDVYDTILSAANKQDVWDYNDDVDVWSIEWDSGNTPSTSYPQTYDRMATIMTALVEVTGKRVLQWAFLTSARNTDIAYIRPKLASYYAARLTVHDHQTFYEGLVSGGENQADSQQYAQYLRFNARYSYYLDHPDLEWIQRPENDYFTLSASKDLFWSRTVYHRLDEGKHEYIINVLNLPSNGKIEGQTEIPSTAVNVNLGINKSIGDYEVFCLDADDAVLVPIDVYTSSEDGSYRYYSLPPVRSWQVLVLKEK